MTDGSLRKAVSEPLVHFLIAGAALFAFGGYFGDVDASERQINLDETQVSRLAQQWQQTWRRQPTQQELDGMIREYIKEEVYFREGIRLGLDVDDPIIRRRLRSKMEFLATAEVENMAPTSTELARYYEANNARYAADPAFSFDQRYYGENQSSAQAAINALNAGKSPPVLLIPLPAAMEAASATYVAREFGDGFVKALHQLPTGKWSGPVQSGYGWHAVRVRSVDAAKVAPLVEVSQQVANDWRSETKAKREAEAYQTLLDGYTIRIAKP